MDIRVRVHIWLFFMFLENWALFGAFQALQFWQHQMVLLSFFSFSRATSVEVLEKGQKELNFSKKCQMYTIQVWCQIMKLISDYKFRFYTSRIIEFCLQCHWFYFSSFILSLGHCEGERIWNSSKTKIWRKISSTSINQ